MEPIFPLYRKDSHSQLVLQGINIETTLIVPFIHQLTKFSQMFDKVLDEESEVEILRVEEYKNK